ncbi:hypothetical protein BZA70DRAFT_282043 [Myxozyma melibiosi]|uniref:Bromo domain-containing protein n=1 Tax=Myxozyma melibiosi TaxID=54550 RepID=A0ABR1F1Q4_9ASCO
MPDEAVKQAMLKIVDELTNMRTSKRGRFFSELFMDEPSADDYPEYYEIIKQPMAFNTVIKNVKENKYNDLDAFAAAVQLIFENAMFFNEENSQVHNDASHLQRAFNSKLEKKKRDLGDLATSTTDNNNDNSTSTSKKRKQQELDDEQAGRSVKLKISLGVKTEDDGAASQKTSQKIKLNIGKQRDREAAAVVAQSQDEESEKEEEQVKQEPEPPSSERRGRGRPPRNKASTPQQAADTSSDATETAAGRSLRKSARSGDRQPVYDESQLLADVVDDDEQDGAAPAGTADASGAATAGGESNSSVPALPVVVPGSKPGNQPSAPAKPDESRLRGPGKTIADALITHFAISSNPNHPAFPPYNIDFPPNKSEIFQSFTIVLPAAYSIITISPTLSLSLLTRHYNLYMSLNNRRLSPLIQPSTASRRLNEPPKSYYEIKLNPGVNVVECLVHASPPPPPVGNAAGRVVVAPQRYGMIGGTNMTVNSEGSEKERIVVWIVLQR